jgi:hypothetical protein
MATNYDINYDDERFTQVQIDKQQALTEVENTYGGMVNETDKYYQAQIDASKEWANTQQQLQQDNTDFAIEQIEQQKDKANKDYLKEQSGAYVDWQKQSNKYGANAEQMATSGLENTGFSESAQVSMYNTYQNRVATARESYNNAVLNYNNAIKDARLQNNSALAEIAYTALQQQLELSLQGFQYKNQLLLEQMNKKQEVDNTYYGRYQDVLNQMNQENALAEEVRQYNENLQLQKQQIQEEIRQYNQNYALQVKEYEESIRQFDAELARLKAKDKQEYELEIKQLELEKKQAEQAMALAEKEFQLKQSQLAEQKRQFDESLKASKASSVSGGGSATISKSSGSNSRTSGTMKSGTTQSGSSKKAVNTEYYQGTINPDAKKYGTFENGYQPKGITGYGPVTASGDTITFDTRTLTGNAKRVTQKIWLTPNGFRWYWDGRKNSYVRVPQQNSTLEKMSKNKATQGISSGGGGGHSF